MTRKTWWIARQKGYGSNRYIVSTDSLQRAVIQGAIEQITFGSTNPARFDDMFTRRQWENFLSGTRLKPGDGPIQVTLEVRVRRVR